jgi:TetR/AcrR family transcriptional regulator
MQRAQKSELTRSRILAAAESEFSDKGIYGARIDEIAATAKVNKRMIYEHFESKEGLYRAVLRGVYSKLAEYEESYYIDGLSPEVAISNLVYGSFRFLEANPSFVRILMWENLNGAKHLGEEISEIKRPTIEYIKSQLLRGAKLGIFRDGIDEEQMVISIMNFEFSYFSNMHTLSGILGKDLSESGEIAKRAAFVADVIIGYLTKGQKAV